MKRYQKKSWDDYANTHLTVLASSQLEIYRDVSALAYGDVIDLGCGSSRTTPFLADNKNLISYTGVDSSLDMINAAVWLTEKLANDKFNLVHSKIEDLPIKTFDFGFSIHSYYSWPNPLKTLDHISKLIASKGEFVLVTPNKKLDMLALAKEADKELLAHPNYSLFRSQNLAFAGNEKALFVDMNTLVSQVCSAGFEILSCHQNYYMGGVNFLHAVKP